METPDKPKSKASSYLLLGISFVVPAMLMKGMIAFVGVGTAFLYLHYKQLTKEKNP